MEELRDKLHITEKYVVGICLFICGLYSFPNFFANVSSGIDESWVFALNYSTRGGKGFVFGKDLFFNYGPLGFLQHPQNINSNLFWGLLIWGAIWTLNVLLLFSLYKKFSFNIINCIYLILGTYLYVTIQFNPGDEYIFYIGLLLLTAMWNSNVKYIYSIIFWILISLSFLYKFSSFVEVFFSMICFTIILFVVKREVKRGLVFLGGESYLSTYFLFDL